MEGVLSVVIASSPPNRAQGQPRYSVWNGQPWSTRIDEMSQQPQPREHVYFETASSSARAWSIWS